MSSSNTTPQQETLREGGCFCARLRYRVRGKPRAINACHCRDCQRLSGSAFAINAMFETKDIEELGTAWSERDIIGSKLGERSWRCAECGVLLYADHPEFGDAVRFVRVGTLDDGGYFVPDAHYFVRSKYPWVTIPPGVPVYETLPGGIKE